MGTQREYWGRASGWAWADAKRFVALHKATYGIVLTLSAGAFKWGVSGIGSVRDLVLVALCAALAILIGLPVVYLFGLVFRAPVALDSTRATTETALRGQIEKLSPKPAPPRHADYRESLLRDWINAMGRAERHTWLRKVVPATENYDHFVPILRDWAARPNSDIEILRELGEESPDIEFRVKKTFFH